MTFPTRIVLRRFGYRLFAAAAGDTLQDWARRLLVCCAHPHPDSATDATHLLLLLLRACFVAAGTLSPLATVLTAVFDDVLALVLDAAAARGDDARRRRQGTNAGGLKPASRLFQPTPPAAQPTHSFT